MLFFQQPPQGTSVLQRAAVYLMLITLISEVTCCWMLILQFQSWRTVSALTQHLSECVLLIVWTSVSVLRLNKIANRRCIVCQLLHQQDVNWSNMELVHLHHELVWPDSLSQRMPQFVFKSLQSNKQTVGKCYLRLLTLFFKRKIKQTLQSAET